MASEKAQKVMDKCVEDPELLIELALVFNKARVKAKVNLTVEEKAEVFTLLANAINAQVITGP